MTDPFVAGAGALLGLAAGWDAARFRIPNALCLSLAGLFAARAVILPDAMDETGQLLPVAIVFIVAALMFARGLMGGGDVKLLAAATLWVPPAAILSQVLAVSVIGAGLALLLASLRRMIRAVVPAAATGAALPDILKDDAPVPYGIAIAAGTLIHLPWTV